MATTAPKNKRFVFNIAICMIRGDEGRKNKTYLLKRKKMLCAFSCLLPFIDQILETPKNRDL